jgi:YVTN family beta-propeller protein
MNSGDSSISIINTATNIVTATIAAGHGGPEEVSFSPDGSKVYVTNPGSNTVSVINATTNAIIATISVGSQPSGISVSPDNSKVYVTNDGTNTVRIINTATNTVSNTIIVESISYTYGNFISTHIIDTVCSAQFLLYPDTSQAHHYLITDSVSGIAPIHYLWSWGDGNFDSLPNPSHTYTDTGIYTICLTITDSTGCQSSYCDSSYHIMRIENMMAYVSVNSSFTTGVKMKNTQPYSVSIYPNPATTLLHIHQSIPSPNQQLIITDLLGTEVYKEMLTGIDNTISISTWSAGIYFYEVRSNSDIARGKFIVN